MEKRLKRILPLVQKPARYTGGEYGEGFGSASSNSVAIVRESLAFRRSNWRFGAYGSKFCETN